jgi:hypothetical protein
VLTPSRHAPDHELGIPREKYVGAETEPFENPGAEPFDQDVGTRSELQQSRHAVRAFEIERHRAASSEHEIVTALEIDTELRIERSIDKQDIRSHVGEQHAAEGNRADRLELENLDACERACAHAIRPAQPVTDSIGT